LTSLRRAGLSFLIQPVRVESSTSLLYNYLKYYYYDSAYAVL
jgi:hypothetical protein